MSNEYTLRETMADSTIFPTSMLLNVRHDGHVACGLTIPGDGFDFSWMGRFTASEELGGYTKVHRPRYEHTKILR